MGRSEEVARRQSTRSTSAGLAGAARSVGPQRSGSGPALEGRKCYLQRWAGSPPTYYVSDGVVPGSALTGRCWRRIEA